MRKTTFDAHLVMAGAGHPHVMVEQYNLEKENTIGFLPRMHPAVFDFDVPPLPESAEAFMAMV